ncbi:MAG: DEAD/DEAH box helicase family protein, partial [Sulfurimonas sp.]|nr:DEAD/DEAH box helicase family protein [Sulfurimonas sp.]
RYHQLDVVKKLVADVKKNSTGEKYLIQHSAGSGKTNSISWLTHKLSKLSDENEERVFNSVIVITDRKILDKQLQDAIYQLDKTKGLVVKIDKTKNSDDLAIALKNGAKIIITTIQKFSYAYKKIDVLDKKKYAIIIDEAHSSTSGENINYLKQTLAGKTLEEAKNIDNSYENSTEDDVNKILTDITDTSHLSFFAFTATPKDKTLQIFGRVGDDELPHEFHLYSMRQAIEEGFILDTLKNYMLSDTYFKIGKKIKDNPSFDKGGASKAIGKFINLNEHNIGQKVKVIVEDFMSNRISWIDNKAKAMIVTSSRLHALKYKLMLDEYLATHYPYVKSLIAFSGEIEEEGIKYSEESLNHIKESQLPDTFENDNSIKFLIVADKYQTGFDQPKLSVMYVDKMLSDVKAVQTLSRLNRVTKGKSYTFVLDFVNDVETIQNSFAKYYTQSNVEKMTDPNIIFEFYHKIDEFKVCYEQDVKEYTGLYLKAKRTAIEIARMDNLINVAIDRFNEIETIEKKDEFKTYVIKFFRAYNFLIQIYPIKKVSLYMMSLYLSGMLKKFPKDTCTRVELDALLNLDFYKLKRMNGDEINGEDISLGDGGETLQGFSSGSSRTKTPEDEDLNSLIERINNLFGLELSDEDRLAFFDQPLEAHKKNEDLKDIAKVNSYEEFEEQFQKGFFLKTLLTKKSTNEEMFNKILSDSTFKAFMIDTMSQELYRYFNDR